METITEGKIHRTAGACCFRGFFLYYQHALRFTTLIQGSTFLKFGNFILVLFYYRSEDVRPSCEGIIIKIRHNIPLKDGRDIISLFGSKYAINPREGPIHTCADPRRGPQSAVDCPLDTKLVQFITK